MRPPTHPQNFRLANQLTRQHTSRHLNLQSRQLTTLRRSPPPPRPKTPPRSRPRPRPTFRRPHRQTFPHHPQPLHHPTNPRASQHQLPPTHQRKNRPRNQHPPRRRSLPRCRLRSRLKCLQSTPLLRQRVHRLMILLSIPPHSHRRVTQLLSLHQLQLTSLRHLPPARPQRNPLHPQPVRPPKSRRPSRHTSRLRLPLRLLLRLPPINPREIPRFTRRLIRQCFRPVIPPKCQRRSQPWSPLIRQHTSPLRSRLRSRQMCPRLSPHVHRHIFRHTCQPRHRQLGIRQKSLLRVLPTTLRHPRLSRPHTSPPRNPLSSLQMSQRRCQLTPRQNSRRTARLGIQRM